MLESVFFRRRKKKKERKVLQARIRAMNPTNDWLTLFFTTPQTRRSGVSHQTDLRSVFPPFVGGRGRKNMAGAVAGQEQDQRRLCFSLLPSVSVSIPW
jgi:hypothetical protein